MRRFVLKPVLQQDLYHLAGYKLQRNFYRRAAESRYALVLLDFSDNRCRCFLCGPGIRISFRSFFCRRCGRNRRSVNVGVRFVQLFDDRAPVRQLGSHAGNSAVVSLKQHGMQP